MSDNKRESNTAVLEPEVDKKELVKRILFPERHKEEQKEEKREEPKFDIHIERRASEPQKTFEDEVYEEEVIKEELFEEEQETTFEAEEEVEEETEEELENEKETEKQVAKLETLEKPKKSLKMRIKLMIIVYIATLTGFGSWAIYNAVDNANIARDLSSAQEIRTITEQTYESKTKALEKVMTKLGKLDTVEEVLNDMDEANIIELTPKELVNPTDFSVESNWFDKVCNWFSRLFGR